MLALAYYLVLNGKAPLQHTQVHHNLQKNYFHVLPGLEEVSQLEKQPFFYCL